MKNVYAKPFLKWAGGKTQLLQKIDSLLPQDFGINSISTYYEPFLGGGAVFFHILQNYPIKRAVLSDINKELVLAYQVVKQNLKDLIYFLSSFQEKYKELNKAERKAYFYEIREHYNQNRFSIDYRKYNKEWVPRAAQLIFLNKTCFNGLFRLNKSGGFNVPFGDYKNPKILDKDNLNAVSKILKKAEIKLCDFSHISKNSRKPGFVYFDPPYRPISKTASFTSYSTQNFDDGEQKRLFSTFIELDKKGFYLMLSNSDPKNQDPKDNFFDDLYGGYNIRRVSATRMINSVASKRGKIKELIITNY